LTVLSSRSGRAVATFLNFYVTHGSTARFVGLRGGEKYIYSADNSLLFPAVKGFSKFFDEVIAKSSTPVLNTAYS